jgi:hypothetical protein
MAESIQAYIRDVEEILHDNRVLNNLQRELRGVTPKVTKAIRTRALDTLPKGGGLNKWVAAIQIKARQETSGKTVRIKLKGGRNSAGGQSDIDSIDQGQTRHPTFGKRGRGKWHVTNVTPGFFTLPATEPEQWRAAADRALDTALEAIR